MTLAQGWNEWAAQVFRADVENWKKEGHKFYKMDKNNIKNLREDLIAEFQAFTQTHTTVIGNLLEEFNDDRLLVTIETKGYEHEHLQAEKEAEVATQVSADVLTERATQETKEDVVRRVNPKIE